MATDDELAMDQQETIRLLIIALISLVAGFTIGIIGGNMSHLSRLIVFLLSFGISFAIFLLLFVLLAAIAFFREQ